MYVYFSYKMAKFVTWVYYVVVYNCRLEYTSLDFVVERYTLITDHTIVLSAKLIEKFKFLYI